MNSPKSPETSGRNGQVLDLLNEDADQAAVASFVELCRQSTALRGWLWQEFAISPKTRANFAHFLDSPDSETADRRDVLAQLAGEGKAFGEEKVRLKRSAPGNAVRAFGGLSRQEVEHLCRHYQAGSFDLGAFLLVHAWRQLARDASEIPVPVARASVAFLADAIAGRRSDLLKRLVKVAGYFDRNEVGKIDRITYGHAQWWKLCVLLYLLNHPKHSYRTNELCAYLKEQRLKVDPRDIRAFCAKHSIARDSHAGRPRKI